MTTPITEDAMWRVINAFASQLAVLSARVDELEGRAGLSSTYSLEKPGELSEKGWARLSAQRPKIDATARAIADAVLHAVREGSGST